MNLKKFTATSMLAIIALPAAAELEIDLASSIAQDSNPFRLNDSLFNTSADTYIHNLLGFDLDLGVLEVDGKISDRSYQDDARADSQKIDLKAELEFNLGKKTELELGVDFDQFDKTYISRFTGQTFSYQGNNAENRYDYSRITQNISLDHRVNKQHLLGFDLRYRMQDYEDYTAIGLTDLDYDQTLANVSWRYRPNKQWQITPSVMLSQRDYNNRQAEDASGTDIAGTRLRYDYTGFGLALRYKASSKTQLSSKFNMVERTDNGGGYYDTDTVTARFRVKHKHSKHAETNLRLSYSDVDYTRDIQGDIEINSETPSRSGWRAKLSHERRLFELAGKPVMLNLAAEAEDYDAELVQYQYDRYRVSAGLSVQF